MVQLLAFWKLVVHSWVKAKLPVIWTFPIAATLGSPGAGCGEIGVGIEHSSLSSCSSSSVSLHEIGEHSFHLGGCFQYTWCLHLNTLPKLSQQQGKGARDNPLENLFKERSIQKQSYGKN